MSNGRIILDGIEPVLDALGNPILGATLEVFLTGTDSPATIYGAQAGGTPLANPLTSDAAGRFYGQSTTIWADNSQAYDLNLTLPIGGALFYSNVFTLGAPVSTANFLQNPNAMLTGAPTAPTPAINSNNSQIATMAALTQAINAVAIFPTGMEAPFAMTSGPAGWLYEDGTAYSRTQYAALFAAIGTTYGAGDGSTTFNVPDRRGLFLRGLGTNGANNAYSSAALGVLQTDTLQGHLHSPESGATNFIFENGAGTSANVTVGGGNYFLGNLVSPPIGDGTNGSPRTGPETRPANMAQAWFIHI